MKLSMHRKDRKRRRNGFTLVELVVVVAIIAILAFISAPKFTGMVSNARLATFESNHEVIKTAIGMHMTEFMGEIPSIDGGAGLNSGKLGDDIIRFIDGQELTGRPVGSHYEWTGKKLVSVLTDLSPAAKEDIKNGKRPGSLSNSAGDNEAYVLVFCPLSTDSGD